MYRTTRTIGTLALFAIMVLMGNAEAYQHQPRHQGTTVSQTQEEDEGPFMQHMQGMMRHMRGMMQHVQDIVGDMTGSGREDDDDMEEWQRYGRMGHGMMGPHGMMGSGAMLEQEIDRLMQELNLSEAQRAQVQTLLRAHAKEAIRTAAEVAVMRIDLHQLLDAETVDVSRVKSVLQDIAAKDVDLRLAHVTMMQAIRKLLTPEQQQDFRTLQREMMGGHHMGRQGDEKRHHGMRPQGGGMMGPGPRHR